MVGVTTETLPQTSAVGVTFAKSMPRSSACNSLSSGVTPGECLLVCRAFVVFVATFGLILFARSAEVGCMMLLATVIAGCAGQANYKAMPGNLSEPK